MKKIRASLLVLALCAPALAVVEFDIIDNADGTATITINTNGAEVRGVALSLTTTDTCTLVSTTATVNPSFNAYLDYYHDNGVAALPGPGHPYAKDGTPGAAAAGALPVSVCLGVLKDDQSGFIGSADLITVEVGAGELCIDADVTRGGAVVGDGDMDTNLPLCETIDPPCATCLGDVTGDGVMDLFNDLLNIALLLDSNDYADICPVPAGFECADMDGDGCITLFGDLLDVALLLDAGGYADIPCEPPF